MSGVYDVYARMNIYLPCAMLCLLFSLSVSTSFFTLHRTASGVLVVFWAGCADEWYCGYTGSTRNYATATRVTLQNWTVPIKYVAPPLLTCSLLFAAAGLSA